MLFDPEEQMEILQTELRALSIDIEGAFREIQKLTLDIHNLERLRKSVRKMIDDLEAL
jgi:prefoldin subunit 5